MTRRDASPRSIAISSEPRGARPFVSWIGFSSLSVTQSRPVEPAPKLRPLGARNATGPVTVPATPATPGTAAIFVAVAPGIRSFSANEPPGASVVVSATTATSTLPYWRSTSPSSALMTRSLTKPVAVKNATPVRIARSVAT